VVEESSEQGKGEGALTDEVEDDAAVGEPPRRVVEVGPALRRRDTGTVGIVFL
jgi:hypothetical protein